MCGIVGYTGTSQATDILIDGLKRMEYLRTHSKTFSKAWST